MNQPPRPPVALTIAGSDSGGGAGIQADLKTFDAFRVFGTTAITAVTAQNTMGVQAVHPIPLEVVRKQVRAVAEDLPPDAIKSGMLATSPLVELVAEELVRLPGIPYVLDPVMVATSGDRLLDSDAVEAVRDSLVPLATLVTPNLPEARILTGEETLDLHGMRRAARALVEMGAGAALVKGGHLEGDEVLDLVWDGREETLWRRARVHTRHTHGTGCTLSAAVTAGLARGLALGEAVEEALAFLDRALRTAPGLGAGHGPLNHFAPAS